MREFMVIRPDGHYGWVFASTYRKADEMARDFMGEFAIVLPTGRVID